MTHDLTVHGHNAGGGAGLGAYPVMYDSSAAPAAEANVFRMAHRLLRGRYLLAIILAAIGAAGGGAIGYLSQTPKYRSEGQIHIRPVFLTFDGREAVMPMFTSFVATQRSYLRSDRVISRAVDSEAWRSLGRPRSPRNEQLFRRSLRVDSPPDSTEIIIVSFTDLEPRAAKIAVEQIIDAYDDLHGSGVVADKDVMIRRLESTLADNKAETVALQQTIDREASEYGGIPQLETRLTFETTTALQLQQEVFELERRLAGLPVAPPQPQPGAPGPAVVRPTAQEIARLEPELRNHLATRDTLERALQTQLNNGYGEQHPLVVRLKSEIESWNTVIDNFVRDWVPSGDATLQGDGQMTVAFLRTRLENLKAQQEERNKRLAEVQRRRFEINKAERRIAELSTQAADIKSRIDRMRAEQEAAQTVGMIETFPPLIIPSSPNVDPRKKLAAAGFVLGGGLPVAIIALIGLLDRRFRYSDDTCEAGPSIALLGMLPILPRSGASPEQAAAAAQSVHQIRSLIQLGAADHKVIAVTSATAGDGKTSLTLSLGMSFAASGARTLLVDFDMIGRGLSRQLKVDAAPHGLADALQSGVLNGCILPSSVPGLSVVPLRSGDERFINRLSDGLVQRFLDSVRPDFDVVLFDTGPILGSLEANFVVAAADGVLVIVGRGQQRPLVQRALAHLGSVGSCVIGLVFNRASAVDFRRSASSASFRTVSAVPADALTLAPLPPEAANLDPISRTVAADIRT